jgi:simple sugar transport system permease protein
MKSVKIGDFDLQIRKREEKGKFINIGVVLGAVVSSFILVGIVISSYGVSPIEAFQLGFSYALSPSGFSGLIVRMIPLLLVGLAVYIPLRAGLYNVAGGAGIYGGGIAAAAIGLATPGAGRLSLLMALTGGAIAGMVILAIPGILRAYWDINEILTTLLLSFMFVRLNNYAVTVMRGEGGTLTGEALPPNTVSPTIGSSSIHIGLLIAILGFVLAYFLFRKTAFGYEIDMFGDNPTAAVRSGINRNKVIIGTFLLGGLLSGVAGASEVVGLHGRLLPDFSPGYGFTAVAIAIIGRKNIYRVLGATFLFAFVYIWGARIELLLPVPTAVIAVFEATVILFFLVGEGIVNYRVDVQKQTSADEKEVISV